MATVTADHTSQPLHPSMKGKLDPVFEDLYNEHIAHRPRRPPNVELLRQGYSALYDYASETPPEVARVFDSAIPLQDGFELPIRVYEPPSEGPWKVHLNFHGGGFALGDLDVESGFCRRVCSGADVVVIDVGYRLAPEHSFPTCVTDCLAALQHTHLRGSVVYNIDPNSISIGGVSAGAFIALAIGHLAAEMSILLRVITAGTPVICDVTEFAAPAESPFASHRENEFAPLLNWQALKWFGELRNSSAMISRPSSNLDSLTTPTWLGNLMTAPQAKGNSHPRTVIYTAAVDPMRDEGEAYGMKLIKEGVEVTMLRFPGVPHPFVRMDKALWQAREYHRRMTEEICRAHSTR